MKKLFFILLINFLPGSAKMELATMSGLCHEKQSGSATKHY
jgi:hypothetical protein